VRAELQTLHATIPPTFNARKRWGSRATVRLLLSDDGEGIGIGEAAPLAGMSTETVNDVRDALAHFDWPEQAPTSLAGVARVVARIDEAVPSARFAAETALLSLWTSRLGMPLWAAWAEEVSEIPIAATLWGSDDRQLVETARELAAYQVPAVKVKIGRAAALDEWLLEAVRGVLPEAELRLDANGALEPDELDERLAVLSEFYPAFLEEPCALAVIEERAEVPFPMAVDETLAGPDGDAIFERALACEHVGAVVLKPTLLGGLGRCHALARRAKDQGLRAIVSHALEGPIARAACAHLALALGPEAAGLGDHPALEPLSDGLCTPWIDLAWIAPPEEPGLGLELAF